MSEEEPIPEGQTTVKTSSTVQTDKLEALNFADNKINMVHIMKLPVKLSKTLWDKDKM